MAQEFELTNKDNSKSFRFVLVTDVRDRVSQPSNSISLINSNWSNKLHFKVFGQTRTIQIRFALYDSTEDLADGTHTSAVQTLDEQIYYLQTHLYQAGFDVEYRFGAGTGGPDRYTQSDGVIDDLEIEEVKGPMKVATGTLTFTFGQVNLAG